MEIKQNPTSGWKIYICKLKINKLAIWKKVVELLEVNLNICWQMFHMKMMLSKLFFLKALSKSFIEMSTIFEINSRLHVINESSNDLHLATIPCD